MLRIYQDALVMVKEVYALAERVGQHDRDLARQMRRAGSSVPLNLAEGGYSLRGHRLSRYTTAMGSANEVRSALQVATAVGWLRGSELAGVEDRLDKIVATLWRLTH